MFPQGGCIFENLCIGKRFIFRHINDCNFLWIIFGTLLRRHEKRQRRDRHCGGMGQAEVNRVQCVRQERTGGLGANNARSTQQHVSTQERKVLLELTQNSSQKEHRQGVGDRSSNEFSRSHEARGRGGVFRRAIVDSDRGGNSADENRFEKCYG